MITWLAAAAVAALAGSPHCIGMCGALACAAGAKPTQQVAYHLGRIATYTALGALSGAFGQAVPGPPWLGTAVAAGLLVVFAASLAGLVPEPRFGTGGVVRAATALAQRADLPSRVAFGAVNGLLPCGLVYATLALAVSTAAPLQGALVMATFGLMTVPALAVAALGLRRLVQRSLAARRALAVLVLVSGLGTLWMRGSAAAAAPDHAPACHHAEK
ncbi:MAG: sulfite exporter TauE/SafE family protein [Myxococcota bacterium]